MKPPATRTRMDFSEYVLQGMGIGCGFLILFIGVPLLIGGLLFALNDQTATNPDIQRLIERFEAAE